MSNISKDDRGGGLLPSRQVRTTPVEYIRPQIVQAPAPEETDDVTVLMQYLGLFWKHKGLLILGAVIGMLIGTAMTLAAPPFYGTQTSLLIQEAQERFNPMGGADPGLNTKMQLLRSNSMRYRVRKKALENPERMPEVQDPLQPLRNLLGLKNPADLITWEEAIADASSSLGINPTRESNILILSTQSRNPAAAAAFVNTLAQEYIAQGNEERLASYHEAGNWLGNEGSELKSKFEDSQRKLQEFARANGLIIVGGANAAEQHLQSLNGQLTTAKANLV